MTIIEIKEQIEIIENNSIKRKRGIEELVAEWIMLMKVKEGFLAHSMSGLEVNEVEDIKFKLIESILLCKMSIRENQGINAKNELEALEKLYGGVQ